MRRLARSLTKTPPSSVLAIAVGAVRVAPWRSTDCQVTPASCERRSVPSLIVTSRSKTPVAATAIGAFAPASMMVVGFVPSRSSNRSRRRPATYTAELSSMAIDRGHGPVGNACHSFVDGVCTTTRSVP